MTTALMEVSGLRKSFDGVAALLDGRFHLRAGSVHALCGGNGAGKSTFLRIVMGIETRDGGEIRLDGRPVSFAHPAAALAAGIAIIEQELSPILDMSVAENIYLGREPVGRFGRVDFAAMTRDAARLLAELEFAIDPRATMRTLSIGQVQLVEIAKAISHDARIIIMDEPSSALGEADVANLYAAVRRLRAQGKGIVYVSHRLAEIFELADDYTVFRDARDTTAAGRQFRRLPRRRARRGHRPRHRAPARHRGGLALLHRRRRAAEHPDRRRRHGRAGAFPEPDGSGRALNATTA